jgi:hypothetical protein
MKGAIVIIVVSFMLAWLPFLARGAKPKRDGESWIFPAMAAVHFVYCGGMLLGLLLIVLALTGPSDDRNLIITGGLGFFLFSVLTWPKAIWVQPAGILQRSWYGGSKYLPWHVVSKVKSRRDRSIIVTDRSQLIVFTPFHVARDYFLEKLAEHGKELAVDGTARGRGRRIQ